MHWPPPCGINIQLTSRVLNYPNITTHALRMVPMGARKGLGSR